MNCTYCNQPTDNFSTAYGLAVCDECQAQIDAAPKAPPPPLGWLGRSDKETMQDADYLYEFRAGGDDVGY